MAARVELGTVSHFTVIVRDVTASVAWWTASFALESTLTPSGSALLSSSTVLIVLRAGTPNATDAQHFAFNLPDMPALRGALETLKANGVTVEDPGDEIGPTSPGSTSMGLWFHDLDGYRWELIVRP